MRKAGSVEKIFLRAAELLASGKKYCCCHAINEAGSAFKYENHRMATAMFHDYYHPLPLVKGEGFVMAQEAEVDQCDTFWMMTKRESAEARLIGGVGEEEIISRRVLAMVNMAQIARMEGV